MSAGYTVSNDWQTIKVSLTSAQILQLFTTPIAILPAPGVGKAYQIPDTNMIRLNFGTVAYATNFTIILIYDTVNKQAVVSNGFILQAPQTKIANFLLATSTATLTAPQIMTNTPLYVSVGTGNPTAGNGTVDIWLTYRIIDLT